MAARRVAQQLGIQARFVVGDTCYLPFATSTFANVFSYASFNISHGRIHLLMTEMDASLIVTVWRAQMPTRYGIRCLHQLRRGFSDGQFDVRAGCCAI
jgi:hypothetical protein